MKTVDRYIKLVCDYIVVDQTEVLGKSRKGDLPLARQWVCYLLKKHTTLSLSTIAEAINSPSHCATIHGDKMVKNFLEVDKKFQVRFKGLIEKASILEADIEKEQNGPNKGDMCWFRENPGSLPYLGRFQAVVVDASGRLRYLIEGRKETYANCEPIHHSIPPERFKNRYQLQFVYNEIQTL
jgi:hypothetical protein